MSGNTAAGAGADNDDIVGFGSGFDLCHVFIGLSDCGWDVENKNSRAARIISRTREVVRRNV